jgi:hypothetical protein
MEGGMKKPEQNIMTTVLRRARTIIKNSHQCLLLTHLFVTCGDACKVGSRWRDHKHVSALATKHFGKM